MKKMSRQKVVVEVSDHAMLRWLQREFDLDIDGLKARLAARTIDAAELGAVAIQIGRVRLLLSEPAGPNNAVTIKTALPRKTHALRLGGNHE